MVNEVRSKKRRGSYLLWLLATGLSPYKSDTSDSIVSFQSSRFSRKTLVPAGDAGQRVVGDFDRQAGGLVEDLVDGPQQRARRRRG